MPRSRKLSKSNRRRGKSLKRNVRKSLKRNVRKSIKRNIRKTLKRNMRKTNKRSRRVNMRGGVVKTRSSTTSRPSRLRSGQVSARPVVSDGRSRVKLSRKMSSLYKSAPSAVEMAHEGELPLAQNYGAAGVFNPKIYTVIEMGQNPQRQRDPNSKFDVLTAFIDRSWIKEVVPYIAEKNGVSVSAPKGMFNFDPKEEMVNFAVLSQSSVPQTAYPFKFIEGLTDLFLNRLKSPETNELFTHPLTLEKILGEEGIVNEVLKRMSLTSAQRKLILQPIIDLEDGTNQWSRNLSDPPDGWYFKYKSGGAIGIYLFMVETLIKGLVVSSNERGELGNGGDPKWQKYKDTVNTTKIMGEQTDRYLRTKQTKFKPPLLVANFGIDPLCTITSEFKTYLENSGLGIEWEKKGSNLCDLIAWYRVNVDPSAPNMTREDVQKIIKEAWKSQAYKFNSPEPLVKTHNHDPFLTGRAEGDDISVILRLYDIFEYRLRQKPPLPTHFTIRLDGHSEDGKGASVEEYSELIRELVSTANRLNQINPEMGHIEIFLQETKLT
jgi:hypothetical protein